MCGYPLSTESAADLLEERDREIEAAEKIANKQKEQRRVERLRKARGKELANAAAPIPLEVLKWAAEQVADVIFYTTEKRGKYRCVCSHCREIFYLDRARSGRVISCPRCGAETIIKKQNSDFGYDLEDGSWKVIAYIERAGDAWMQRIFGFYRTVSMDVDGMIHTRDYISEEERDILFPTLEPDGSLSAYYYHPCAAYTGPNVGKWIPGCGKVHGQGWTGYRLRSCKIYTYPYNLSELFSESEYRYSGIYEMATACRCLPTQYLYFWEKEPKLELLSKLGLRKIIEDIVFDSNYGETMRHLRNIKSLKDLGIEKKEEIEECRTLSLQTMIARKEVKKWNVDAADLWKAWAFIRELNRKSGEDFAYSFVTRERMFKYCMSQCPEAKVDDPDRFPYFVSNFLRDYIDDYIPDCIELGLNMNDTAISLPRDFQKAHKWAADELKCMETKVYDKLIEAVYESLHGLCEWSDGKLLVMMPRSSREIVEEGVRQSHCVGRYCERVAKGESVILFIRRTEDPEKSFYTLELKKDMRNYDQVQCRGHNNEDMTKEVRSFLKKYKSWFNHRSIGEYDGDSVMVHYFKAVRKSKDGRYISNYDGKTEFKIGEWAETATDKNPDIYAVKGLHVASLEFAVRFGHGWKDLAILEVETNIHDVVVPNATDQVRTSRFRVIREVGKSEYEALLKTA